MSGFAQDHGRAMSQWSTSSARGGHTREVEAPKQPTEPVFTRVIKKCDAGIHVVTSYGDACEMCRVIAIGGKAAAMRRVTV